MLVISVSILGMINNRLEKVDDLPFPWFLVIRSPPIGYLVHNLWKFEACVMCHVSLYDIGSALVSKTL